MRNGFFVAICTALLLVGCGSKDTEPSGASASVVASLPVTLDGQLVGGLGDGDEDGATPEYIYGTLMVGQEDVEIVVSGSLWRSSGFTDSEDAKVRATISGKKEDEGTTEYTVTALQRL